MSSKAILETGKVLLSSVLVGDFSAIREDSGWMCETIIKDYMNSLAAHSDRFKNPQI